MIITVLVVRLSILVWELIRQGRTIRSLLPIASRQSDILREFVEAMRAVGPTAEVERDSLRKQQRLDLSAYFAQRDDRHISIIADADPPLQKISYEYNRTSTDGREERLDAIEGHQYFFRFAEPGWKARLEQGLRSGAILPVASAMPLSLSGHGEGQPRWLIL